MVIKIKRNPKNERIVKGIFKATFLYLFAVFGIINTIITGLFPGKGISISPDLAGLLITQIISVLITVVGLLLGTSILIEAHEKNQKRKNSASFYSRNN